MLDLRFEQVDQVDSSVTVTHDPSSIRDPKTGGMTWIRGPCVYTLSLTVEDMDRAYVQICDLRGNANKSTLLDPEFSKQCLSH
jgi:hypothetical protein